MNYEICPKCGKWKLPKGKTIDEAGYRIVDYHRAVLFTEHEQQTLTNSTIKKPKGRLSFFKRLSWAKGSPIAQWEDILFAMMPKSGDDRK